MVFPGNNTDSLCIKKCIPIKQGGGAGREDLLVNMWHKIFHSDFQEVVLLRDTNREIMGVRLLYLTALKAAA